MTRFQSSDPPSELPAAPAPKLSERAKAEKAAREARQAEALRANLRRRKEQQRSRGTDAPGDKD
jgi:hypothetical protein